MNLSVWPSQVVPSDRLEFGDTPIPPIHKNPEVHKRIMLYVHIMGKSFQEILSYQCKRTTEIPTC